MQFVVGAGPASSGPARPGQDRLIRLHAVLIMAKMSSTRMIQARSAVEIASAAREGAQALRAGQLVGFATETVYGIAAVASDATAMERLRELKSRPSRPFSVHLGRPQDVERYVASIPADATRLIRKAWPGPVTVILPAGGRLADSALQEAGLYDVLCSEDLIGLRCPHEPLAEAMLSAVREPVVAPSANPAGAPSPRSADDVRQAMNGQIDLLIDSGPCRYGKDSTIVSFASGQWAILREGVLNERSIRKLLHRTYLFVCTGNTCRSPMAAGLAAKLLAEKLGCTVPQLADRGVRTLSAGVFATSGSRATPEAVQAARRLGVDISPHRSRKLTKELIQSSDVVFCMTRVHLAEAVRLAGSASADIRMLCDDDLSDPIGRGVNVYEQTARRIEHCLRLGLVEQGL
ncbi:MAG: Threonylcarbamoyl-AMP synthase [Planctomycetes bacterium ADurb.Bin126]|nr:MAG: Threonylcarbamoyl-AMP synthase [Planctomycetes bacterium ADurb.Bin126]